MKALVCRTHGGPETLQLEDVPAPEAGPGQVVVAIEAAGVNFPDTLIIQGKYQYRPELPFSPGAEFAGKVKSIGAGVTRFALGQPVAGLVTWGAFAEEIAVDADRLMPLPAGADPKVAAAFGLTYGTTYHALKDRAHLQPGETLLVLGAAGGVGLAAVELGTLMGARVIAAASSDEKLATCTAYGAAACINYEREDLRDAIRSLTDGRGVDVVYDPVGGRFTEPAVRGLAWKGRLLVVGFAAGDIPRIPLNLVLLKGAALMGVFWGDFSKRERALNAANLAELLAWVSSGRLKPLVSATYPLARGAEAIAHLAGRHALGKIVITMPGAGSVPAAAQPDCLS